MKARSTGCHFGLSDPWTKTDAISLVPRTATCPKKKKLEMQQKCGLCYMSFHGQCQQENKDLVWTQPGLA